jgi:hypothetical protein
MYASTWRGPHAGDGRDLGLKSRSLQIEDTIGGRLFPERYQLPIEWKPSDHRLRTVELIKPRSRW